MDWKKITTLDAMPKEACDCWVFWDVPMHLVWNPDHDCWDDDTADDHFAEWNQPTHYIILPWKRPENEA